MVMAQDGHKLRTKIFFFKIGTWLNRMFVCAVKSILFYSTVEVMEPIPLADGKKRTLSLLSPDKDRLKTYKASVPCTFI
jgi:hypothetical protein